MERTRAVALGGPSLARRLELTLRPLPFARVYAGLFLALNLVLLAMPDAWREAVQVVLAISLVGMLSGMTYGPVAAWLVELFPARVRYTSLSIPYHIGSGYFGGFLPFIYQYIVARTGDPFGGLWYVVAVTAVALVVALFGLPETRGKPLE